MRTHVRSILLLSIVAMSVSLFAQGFRGPRHRGPGGFLSERFLTRVLQLSDEQLAQAEALRGDLRAAVRPLREEARLLRGDLSAQLKGESPDPAAVGTAVIALAAIREEIRASFDRFVEDFKAILTPEQLEKLERFLERRRQRRSRREAVDALLAPRRP